MTESNETCEYVLDPDDPETWGEYIEEKCERQKEDEPAIPNGLLNEDGVWTCPHNVEVGEDQDLCIFHQPVDGKPDEAVVDAFFDTVNETTASDDAEERNQRLEFIGAKFGKFEPSDDSPDVLTEEADMTMRYAQINDMFSLSGMEFRGDVDFRYAEFAEEADFREAEFAEEADFREAEFGKWSNFIKTEFGGEAKFGGAEFVELADFGRAKFGQKADFVGVNFGGEAKFRGANFREKANFLEVEFGKKADFSHVKFREKAKFRGAEFIEMADFADANFREKAEFGRIDFEGDVSFRDVGFKREANFSEQHLEDVNFQGADLSGANLERAKLLNTDLFGTDLSGAKLYGARTDGAAINTETVFDRHGDHRCVYDPNSEYEYEPDEEEKVDRVAKAMGTYHVLEQLTRANTLPDAQGRFFARRQDMRRTQLRKETSFPRFKYWFAEAQNAIFRHGESFSRVVAWSVGAIITFGLLYPLGGWLQGESTGVITYSGIAETPSLLWKSFHHSALLFLTGGGPLSPTGLVGEVIVTAEALMAPILLALLVFVLGRRAAR